MGVKRYFYKIYEPTGTYIKTISDVSEEYPQFNMDINGGVGMLSLNLARSWKDFYASSELALYNELKIIVNDNEDNAKQIYSGYLNRIKLQKDNNGNEQVNLEFVGYVAELPFRILQFATGETALQYDSETVEDILKDVIDKYAGKITYSGSSIGVTGNTVSDIFSVNTIKESIDKVLSRCPVGWYWFVDAENIIWLQRADKFNPDHTLILGRHINNIEMAATMENVYNDIIVIGGTPDGEDQMYKRYQVVPSVEEFGRRTMVKNDGRIFLESSMDYLGNYLLGSSYQKEIEVEFDILDSNIDPERGYDIESIKPGDVIRIKDPRHDTDTDAWDVAEYDEGYWDFDKNEFLNEPIIVESVRYYGTGCKITASKSVPGVGFRLEDVKRNIENYINAQVPVVADNISGTEENSGEEVHYEYDANGNLVKIT